MTDEATNAAIIAMQALFAALLDDLTEKGALKTEAAVIIAKAAQIAKTNTPPGTNIGLVHGILTGVLEARRSKKG